MTLCTARRTVQYVLKVLKVYNLRIFLNFANLNIKAQEDAKENSIWYSHAM